MNAALAYLAVASGVLSALAWRFATVAPDRNLRLLRISAALSLAAAAIVLCVAAILPAD